MKNAKERQPATHRSDRHRDGAATQRIAVLYQSNVVEFRFAGYADDGAALYRIADQRPLPDQARSASREGC